MNTLNSFFLKAHVAIPPKGQKNNKKKMEFELKANIKALLKKNQLHTPICFYQQPKENLVSMLQDPNTLHLHVSPNFTLWLFL